jgi:hypothetical protein
MTFTSAGIITNALRLYGIIDQTEAAQPADIANNVVVLNDLLRNEQADGAVQYLMKRVSVQLPQGVSGQIYSFSIGTGSTSYLVQQDVVAVKAIWMNDLNNNVNRETRMAPIADVVRTTYPGIITKWHQERQSDGSVLITAWQPPRAVATALIEYGGRLPLLSDPLGGDVVALPPEGIHDATLMLGATICGSYGRSLQSMPELAARAQRVNDRWRDWVRGNQWVRLVRS